MKTLHFSTTINATPEKVWEVMLTDQAYREWTSAFQAGSHFEGSWEEGSEIRFVSEEDGKVGGIAGKITESHKPEVVNIQYEGAIVDGAVVVDASPESWSQSSERYTFIPVDEGTQLNVELLIPDEFVEMMSEPWPRALAKLKQIVEAN